MSGYCESCDHWVARLLSKGRLWLCARCLEREL
jgi:hypothetical protein